MAKKHKNQEKEIHKGPPDENLSYSYFKKYPTKRPALILAIIMRCIRTAYDAVLEKTNIHNIANQLPPSYYYLLFNSHYIALQGSPPWPINPLYLTLIKKSFAIILGKFAL